MNRKRLREIADQLFAEEMKIFEEKGTEYTMSNDDALTNFKKVGEMVGVTCPKCEHSFNIGPRAVFAVYWLKHVFSILNYVKRGRVFSEPIAGRVNDVRNYPIFLLGLDEDEPGERSEGSKEDVGR